MSGPPIKLAWLEAVAERAAEDNPPNHSAILALAVVLILHAKRDGGSVYPSQKTMGRESGLRHPKTVRAAIGWLIGEGFLTHIRNRARGLREYRLTFPGEARQMANEGLSDRWALSDQLDSDGQSDRHSPGHSLSTNPGNPVNPEKTSPKERQARCSNCEVVGGHELDCPYLDQGPVEDEALRRSPLNDDARSLEDRKADALKVLSDPAMADAVAVVVAALDAEVVPDPDTCCQYCDRCDDEVVECNGIPVHPDCAPSDWKCA